ncbi:trafficking kinesin-binding protein 1, partial [Engraulis encrasicolus]|uniref:trafficking kinesin-binding protein 1 n=1 Tax=Engraulis encrasicolus TaxID=184585 RepID=UPI002FD1E932
PSRTHHHLLHPPHPGPVPGCQAALASSLHPHHHPHRPSSSPPPTTTLNRLPLAKLSQAAGTARPQPTSQPQTPHSPQPQPAAPHPHPRPVRPPRPSLENRGPRSVHGEQTEGRGAPSSTQRAQGLLQQRRSRPLSQAPQGPPAAGENKAGSGRQAKDVSTLTDISHNLNLPEVELVSLLTEDLPRYTLRADCVFGYDHDDWLRTPILPPGADLGLSPELIEETLKYFLLCSERVGQVTKTYHDIEAVTHLLEEKERDLELAARIGQSLLKQNRELTERNELLDEQLEIAKEEIAQLRHELSMRDDLLHFYASTEELEMATEGRTTVKRNESSSSLTNLIQYDFLQQKLKSLEEENHQLRSEAYDLTSETTDYEEREQQLMMGCVDELSSANKRAVELSDELARKVEDSLRQQEEISGLLGQIVDLQQKCKTLTNDNEELNQQLNTSRDGQTQLRSELRDMQEKYSECEDMLREAREVNKNLRNKNAPNSTVQRFSALETVIPMDSLAAEIEGTFRKGIDSPAPSEYKNHPLRVFETVKVANQVARLRSRCASPGVPGSSPVSMSGRSSLTSTPRTSYYGSDAASLQYDDKGSTAASNGHSDEHGRRMIGQPGTPGGHDLEAALRNLSARQQSHVSERPFFEVERERKLRMLAWHQSGEGADGCDGILGGVGEGGGEEVESSSGFLTPSSSTGTNYSGSSRHSAGSGLSTSSRSCLPDRLQIVKPLEGSVTLHHWQQLARPNLGGILHPRPGVLTKDFRTLDIDLQHVYSLNDLEEDEEDCSALARLSASQRHHGSMAHHPPPSGPNHHLPQTSPTFSVTNCRVLHHHPSLFIPTLSSSLSAHSLSACGSCEHVTGDQPPFPPQPALGVAPHLQSPLSTIHPSSVSPSNTTITTISTTTPDTQHLGLLGLLQKEGISAGTYPYGQHHGGGPSPLPPPSNPLTGKVARRFSLSGASIGGGGGAEGTEGLLAKVGGERSLAAERKVFSLNLVEKLLSLGLHSIAARGMVDSSGAERRLGAGTGRDWRWSGSMRTFIP